MSASLAAGDRLGSYTIVSLIGKGGMGEVYKARDEKLERDVAIKVLPDALLADEKRVDRLEREADDAERTGSRDGARARVFALAASP